MWEVRNVGWLVHAFQVMTRKMGKHMDLRDQGGDLELERSPSPLGMEGLGKQPHRKGRRRRWQSHWCLPGVAELSKVRR